MARDKRSPKQLPKPQRESSPPAVGDLLEQIQADHAGARQAWGALRERMIRRRAELREEAMQAQLPQPPALQPLGAPVIPPYSFAKAEPPDDPATIHPLPPEAAEPPDDPATVHPLPPEATEPPDDPATVHPLPPEQAIHDFQSFLGAIGEPPDDPATVHPLPPEAAEPPDDDPATVHPLPPEQAVQEFQAFLYEIGDAPTASEPTFTSEDERTTPDDSTLAEVELFIQHLQAELGISPEASLPESPDPAAWLSPAPDPAAWLPPALEPPAPNPATWLPPAPEPPAPEHQPETTSELLDPALAADLMHAFSAYDPPESHQATLPLPTAEPLTMDALLETEALLAELQAELGTAPPTPPPAPAAPALPITELHPEVVPVAPLSGARLERVLHPTTAVQRHLKKIGDVAYVQLCRVGLGVRRLLESQSDLPDTQHQLLSSALLELQQHVRTLLEELERAYRQTPATERRTLADFVELVGHNMGMLRRELDMTERTAEARQHFLISTYAGEMHRQITLLLYDLQAAYQTIVMEPWRHLLGGPPPPPEHTRGIAPGAGSNDLTRIEGIGTGMQQRLHQAGIYTYARLAQSNPDELRLILGNMAPYIDVDAWISAARRLAP